MLSCTYIKGLGCLTFHLKSLFAANFLKICLFINTAVLPGCQQYFNFKQCLFLPNKQLLEPNNMKLYATIALLLSLICSTLVAKTTKQESKLFLVGGGLKTCSSMTIKNCNTNTLTRNSSLKTGKTTSFYQINKKTIDLVRNDWPKHFNRANKQKIIELLRNITSAGQGKVISKINLKSLFKSYDRQEILSKLNDTEYYLLLDLLEQPVLKSNDNTRIKEQVELAHSTNLFSTEIYHEFVVLAHNISKRKKPKILVLTASARDPFEAVDFYLAVFTQAGGDTQWLPLDASLNTLIQQRGDRQKVCQQLPSTRLSLQGSANREYVYPDLTSQQLQSCLSPNDILIKIGQADGIFINGGDQSLTLKAFINNDGTDSKALSLIKEKLVNNNLVIGGTSAGTAVMSGGIINKQAIAMITNGQSNTAIVRGAKKDVLPQEGCQKSNNCDLELLSDDLTYNSKGGLGLFRWGIMDTHFSERGRQGRLAKLVLDTNTRFAFGVDEATALVVGDINTDEPTFNVIGQTGVYIVENNLEAKKKNTVLSHYLTRGDSAILTKQKIKANFASWKSTMSEQSTLPNNINDIFEGLRYQQAAELLCRTDNSLIIANSKWKNNTMKVMIDKQINAKNHYGILTKGDSTFGYCSYQNYQLTISSKM